MICMAVGGRLSVYLPCQTFVGGWVHLVYSIAHVPSSKSVLYTWVWHLLFFSLYLLLMVIIIIFKITANKCEERIEKENRGIRTIEGKTTGYNYSP